jgi:GNAT superfamily N-acetyltransferase
MRSQINSLFEVWLLDIVEIVVGKEEDGDITYRIKVNKKDIGYIKINGDTIEEIWIDESFRNTGYGTMLIRHVEWIAKKSGKHKTMLAHAIKNSAEAKGLMEANGYVLFPDEQGEYDGYKNILNIH